MEALEPKQLMSAAPVDVDLSGEVTADEEAVFAGQKYANADLKVELTSNSPKRLRVYVNGDSDHKDPEGRHYAVHGLEAGATIKLAIKDVPNETSNKKGFWYRLEDNDDTGEGELFHTGTRNESYLDAVVTLQPGENHFRIVIHNLDRKEVRDEIHFYITTDAEAPTLDISSDDLLISENTTSAHQFEVLVTDDLCVHEPSLRAAQFRAVGPQGQTASVRYVSQTPQEAGEVEATYEILAPTGGWTNASGTWRIEYVSGLTDETGRAATPLAPVSFDVIDDIGPSVRGISTRPGDISARNDDGRFVTIEYSDPGGIDETTFHAADLSVSNQTTGDDLVLEVTQTKRLDSGRTWHVTYRVVPPEAGWSRVLNGTYVLQVEEAAVDDLSGNGSNGALVGTLRINVPNYAPEVKEISRFEVADGAYSVDIHFEDILQNIEDFEGDDVSYVQIVSQPRHGEVVPGFAPEDLIYRPHVSWRGGEDSFRIRVTDGTATVDVTVYVTVFQAVAAPEAEYEIQSDTTGLFIDGITEWNESGTYTLTAVFSDDRGFETSTFASGNFVLLPPSGAATPSIPLTMVGAPVANESGGFDVQYRFSAPVGGWDVQHNGSWTLSAGTFIVRDATGDRLLLTEEDTATLDVNVTPTQTIGSRLTRVPVISHDEVQPRFTVVYESLGSIDEDSFDDANITVTRDSDGEELAVRLIDFERLTSDGRQYRVTYELLQPDDDFGWSWRAQGLWSVATSVGEVTDEFGNETTDEFLDSFFINLTNSTPVATADEFTFAEEPNGVYSPFESVLENDTDADDATVDLGVELLTDGEHGHITLDAFDGSFTYTANDPLFSGSDEFQYRITDGNTWSEPATVNVTIQRDRPDGQADEYRLVPGETTLFIDAEHGLLANDADAQDRPLSIVETGEFTLPHGTLTLAEDGSFAYTLTDADFEGDETFLYSVTNGIADEVDVPVTIHVARTATPTDDRYFVDFDGQLDTDAPGVLINDLIIGERAVLVSEPEHGMLEFRADGSFTYTPDPGYLGEDAFEYALELDGNQSVSATVTLSVTAGAPVARADGYRVTEGETLSVPAAGVLENDELPGGQGVAELVNGPASGSLTLNADGSFEYTPEDGFVGTDSFRYQVRSGELQSEVVDVAIAVAVANPLARTEVEFRRPGQPGQVDQVSVGEEFEIDIWISDARSDAEAYGIFSAYLDVLFDSELLEVTGYQNHFGFPENGNFDGERGLIDEVGGLNFSSTGTFETRVHMLTIFAMAKALGEARIVTEAPDNASSQIALKVPGATGIDARLKTDYVTQTITIGDASTDVVVTSFDVINDQVTGTTATVRFTVENHGAGAATDFDVAIIHSDNEQTGDSDDQRVGTAHIDRLEAGESRVIELDVELDRATLLARSLRDDPGGANGVAESSFVDFLAAVVDPDNRLEESNADGTAKSNNSNRGLFRDRDHFGSLPVDFDGDGVVAPLDALNIISRIGQVTNASNAQFDVDGDGIIAPLDALRVITQIGYEANRSVEQDQIIAPTASLRAFNALASFVAESESTVSASPGSVAATVTPSTTAATVTAVAAEVSAAEAPQLIAAPLSSRNFALTDSPYQDQELVPIDPRNTVFKLSAVYSETPVLTGGVRHDDLSQAKEASQSLGGFLNEAVAGVSLILDLFSGGGNKSNGYDPNQPVRYQGSAKSEQVVGGLRPDTIDSGGGHDTVFTDRGPDVIRLGIGHDQGYAGAGKDTLKGGDGDDTLSGDDGCDSLHGEAGNDVLLGGNGVDTFFFRAGDGHDEIIDNDSAGKIVLSGLGFHDLDFRQDGTDLEIRVRGNGPEVEDSLLFRNYTTNGDRTGWSVETVDGIIGLAAAVRGTSWSDLVNLSISAYDNSRILPPVGYRFHDTIDDFLSGLNSTLYLQETLSSDPIEFTDCDGGKHVVETDSFTLTESNAILSIRGTEPSRLQDVISGAMDAEPQFRALENKLVNFLRENSVSRLTVVGHSQGYMVAQWIAAEIASRPEFQGIDFHIVGINGPGVAGIGIWPTNSDVAIPGFAENSLPNVRMTSVVHQLDVVWRLGTHHRNTEWHVIPNDDGDHWTPETLGHWHEAQRVREYLNEHGGRLPAGRSTAELVNWHAETYGDESVGRNFAVTPSSQSRLANSVEFTVPDDIDIVVDPQRPGIADDSDGNVVRSFDMGTDDSPVDPDGVRVTSDTSFTESRGYGWEAAPQAKDQGRANDVERDFAYASELDFLVDLPDGSYDVTVTVGDRGDLHQNMRISLNGYAQETLTTAPGQVLSRTYRVNLLDTRLRVTLSDVGGENPHALLNGIEIREVEAGSPTVVNEEIESNPVIIVLTHGYTVPEWFDAIGTGFSLVDDVVNLVHDIGKVVVSLKSGNYISAIKAGKDVVDDIKSIKSQIDAAQETRVADWVFHSAKEYARQTRNEGLGDLDTGIETIDIDRVLGTSGDKVLREWNGSRDFLVVDWTYESNDGIGVFDFNESRHRDSVNKASQAVTKLLKARIREEQEKNPDAKVDILFVGHGFGAMVNRDALTKLRDSSEAGAVDYVKAVTLDPLALKPDSDKDQRAEDHDRFYWYHPEFNGVLDAVTNLYQTKGVAPGGFIEARMHGFKPLDGREGGGALGFTNRQVRVWDIESGIEELRFRHLQEDTGRITSGQIRDVLYSGDGKWIVSVGGDSQVKVRSAVTGDEWLSLDSHIGAVRDVEMLGDDYVVTVGSKKDLTVQITRLSDATVIAAGHHKNATDVTVSSDGKWFATGGTGKGIKIWQLVEEDGQTTLRHEATLREHEKRINTLAFDPHGQTLIAGGKDRDLLVFTRQGDTYSLTDTIEVGETVRSVKFSGDTLFIAAGKSVALWERSGGTYTPTGAVLRDHIDEVKAIAISDDGQRLASGGLDRTVFVYDVATLEKVGTLNTAQLPIRNLDFNQDGTRVAVAYSDHRGGPVKDIDVTANTKRFTNFGYFLTGRSDYIRHAKLPFVYLQDLVQKYGESFFRKRDNPAASRPGDVEFAHTRRRDNGSDAKGQIDPSAPNEHAVEIVNAPTDQVVSRPVEIVLSDVFRDRDNAPLAFEVTSSDPASLAVRFANLGDGDRLIMTPIHFGSATVTLTATDGSSTQSVTFNVEVKDQGSIEKLAALKEKTRELKESLEGRREDLSDAKSNLRKAATLAKQAIRKLKAFPKAAQRIESKMSTVAASMDQLEEKKDAHQEEQTRLRLELLPLTLRIAELEQRRDEINATIDANSDRLDAVRSRIKQINRELRRAKGTERTNLKEEKRERKSERDTLKRETKELKKERRAANRERRRLEKNSTKHERRIRKIDTKVEKLDRKLDKKQTRMDELDDKLAGRRGLLQESRELLNRATMLRDDARTLFEETPAFEQAAEDEIGRTLAEVHDLREKKLVDRIGLNKFERGMLRNAKRAQYQLERKMDMPQKRLDEADARIDRAELLLTPFEH